MQNKNYFPKYEYLRPLTVSEKCDGQKDPYKMQEWMWLFSQWIVKLRKLENGNRDQKRDLVNFILYCLFFSMVKGIIYQEILSPEFISIWLFPKFFTNL